MTKRKLSKIKQIESSSKKQKITYTDNLDSLSIQEPENEFINREEEIKRWKEEGKIEGLAYGVLALFSQNAIKKPAEMIDGALLNLPNDVNSLYLVEELVDLYSNNTQKAIELIIEFLRGNRAVVTANLIKDNYLKYQELDDMPENFNVLDNAKKKILSIENPTVEDITNILLGGDND